MDVRVTSYDIVDGQIGTTCSKIDNLGVAEVFSGNFFEFGETRLTCKASDTVYIKRHCLR